MMSEDRSHSVKNIVIAIFFRVGGGRVGKSSWPRLLLGNCCVHLFNLFIMCLLFVYLYLI